MAKPAITPNFKPMPDRHTTDYFERRAGEEQTAAEQAADERAAQSHRELSEHYRDLARGAGQLRGDGAEPPEAGIVAREFRILP